MNASCAEWASIPGTKLFVAHREADNAVPFDPALFSWIDYQLPYSDKPNYHQLCASLDQFQPDVLLVSSWHIKEYRRILRRFRQRALRVLCMDNQWHGTSKQWLGVASAPVYVQRLYDAAYVPGDRQADFASRLSFKDTAIWRGLLTCNHSDFAAVYHSREGIQKLPRAFVFVGRFAGEKGIETLLSGYSLYRESTDAPWPLFLAGSGPLDHEVRQTKGCTVLGFKQPQDLPEVLGAASCLVLPSRKEPWAVAIHEAVTAGLGVICSSRCGAGDHLVEHGTNGFIIDPENPNALAHAMAEFSALNEDDLRTISRHSFAMSQQFTPHRWAKTIYENTVGWKDSSRISNGFSLR